MKFCAAAILALSAAPAHSFSYLDTLGGAAPAVAAPPATAEEPPFYFTDEVTDQSADSPAFYFTSGSEDVPASTSSGYLDALGGVGSSAPSVAASSPGTAGSSASYLDILGNGATSVTGPGITSYLDALPKNAAVGGAGINTYASSLNAYASEIGASIDAPAPVAAAPVAAAPTPVAAAPVAAVSDVGSVAGSSASYLDALSNSDSAVSGAGITTYVETLPLTSVLAGGAGINTYASNLVSSSTIDGAGVPTYADTLGGGIPSFTNSFSPFGESSIAVSSNEVEFTMGSVTGEFDFTLEASAEIIRQLKAAGPNGVTITGRFY